MASTPPQPVPEPDDEGTIYLFRGVGGALGYSLGEDQDSYLHWNYATNEVAAFPYDDEGWAAAWGSYNDAEQACEPAAGESPVAEGPLLRGCVFLGGYGHALVIQQAYDLLFDKTRIVVALQGSRIGLDPSVLAAHGLLAETSEERVPVLEIPLEHVTGFEIGGPGAVTTGAGVFGGGFGLEGFLKGAAVATLLNALTTRTKIRTVFRIEAAGGEATFFYSRETPEELRITLAPVFTDLRKRAVPSSPASEPPTTSDPVERLAQLAALLDRGLLTRDEFDRAKTRLLEEL
jgi:hypothetical protein